MMKSLNTGNAQAAAVLARWVLEQGSSACLNGESDAHPTRGR